MPSIIVSPIYPVPKRPVTIAITLTDPAATYVRIWGTDAPEGSSLKDVLKKGGLARVEVHEGGGGAAAPWTDFDFNVGGIYVFAAQEYSRTTGAHGGSFEGDPKGFPGDTAIGAEVTLTIAIGQRLTLQLGAGKDTASLVFHVWGDFVRGTTVADHGEFSPDIIKPTSAKAATAAKATGVLSILPNFKNVPSASIIGDLPAKFLELLTKYQDHIGNVPGFFHANPDADNTMSLLFGSHTSPHTLAAGINKFAGILSRHFRNDKNGTGSGSAAYQYHTSFDQTNLPLITNASDMGQVYALLADCRRAYEAHRTAAGVHALTDTVNVLGTDNMLAQLHALFLASLALSSPVIFQTQNAAAILLPAGAGFVETPK